MLTFNLATTEQMLIAGRKIDNPDAIYIDYALVSNIALSKENRRSRRRAARQKARRYL